MYSDKELDEDHGNMFIMKLSEIIKQYEENTMNSGDKKDDITDDPEKFIDHMVAKSEKLSGIEQ